MERSLHSLYTRRSHAEHVVEQISEMRNRCLMMTFAFGVMAGGLHAAHHRGGRRALPTRAHRTQQQVRPAFLFLASAPISFVAYLAVVDSISNSKLTFSCSCCLPMVLQGDSEGGVLDPVQHRRGHV